jgi:hypothetical protein
LIWFEKGFNNSGNIRQKPNENKFVLMTDHYINKTESRINVPPISVISHVYFVKYERLNMGQ